MKCGGGPSDNAFRLFPMILNMVDEIFNEGWLPVNLIIKENINSDFLFLKKNSISHIWTYKFKYINDIFFYKREIRLLVINQVEGNYPVPGPLNRIYLTPQ